MSAQYPIKGDYFHGQFHLNLDKSDENITKHSPANTEHHLWTAYIQYGNMPKVVESAVAGYKVWKRTSLSARIDILKRYKDIVIGKVDDIAMAIALETGKPLWEAKTEASALASKVDVTINDSLKRIATQEYDNILPDTKGIVNYRPLGPIFIIGPFNFPCHLANGQILSALVAGNSIIFKPSERTIYSSQLMFECLAEAGFPNGVINFVVGTGEMASRIVRDKSIKGIQFTGSVEVGKKILSQTYKNLSKLVALELGGKNTTILNKDANIDFALAELLKSAFLTTGQRCTSTALVAIHHDIKDEVITRFHELAKKLVVDHPIEHTEVPFMGPLIDSRSLETYLTFMGMAKREGIEEVMRGKQLDKGFKGHYVSPSIHYSETLLEKSHFLSNELFGPNVTFIPFNEVDEAIAIANSTEFGLAASVFTQDREFFDECALEIETGLINLNRSTVGASSKLPFGGVKNSGNHHPAAVSMIDACVHSQSTLDANAGEVDFSAITGLKF